MANEAPFHGQTGARPTPDPHDGVFRASRRVLARDESIARNRSFYWGFAKYVCGSPSVTQPMFHADLDLTDVNQPDLVRSASKT